MFGTKNHAAAPFPISALLWLWLGLGLLGVMPGVSAQNIPAWHISQSFTNLNGTTTVLWIISGTSDNDNNYSGDTAAIWTMDTAGNQKSVSPIYGPYAGWQVSQITPNFDGTLRMAWTNDRIASDYSTLEQVSLWKLDSVGNRTSTSPIYGPYAGWMFHALSPQPNGTALVYWTQEGVSDSAGNYSSDALSVWTVDGVNQATTIQPTYGPYAGWRFRDATANIFTRDGTSFLLWVKEGSYSSDGNYTYSGDQTSVWKVDEAGNRTSVGPIYGPYVGWRASYLVPAYDGSARLFWANYLSDIDGNDLTQISLWALDSHGGETSMSPVYGPYPGWNPETLSVAPDNTSRLLWIKFGTTGTDGTYSGDQASLWSLNAVGNHTATSPTYGPYANWSATYQPAWDGTEKMLWEKTDPNDPMALPSSLSLWPLDSSSSLITIGRVYGPYS